MLITSSRWGRALGCALGLAGLLGPTQDSGEDLTSFVEALGRWRSGEVAAQDELISLGERLCEAHERCDARDIATYYLGLDQAALARGLTAEARVDSLRKELIAAGREGLEPGSEWPELRSRLMMELDELCLPDLDPAPAARARALLARLELSIVEEETNLGNIEREKWINSAADHVEGSVHLFESCGMVTPRLEPLWIRGRLARARGDRAGSLTYQAACLELAEQVGNLEYQERALLSLVQLAQDVGDHHRVQQHLASLAGRVDPARSWPLAREHASSLLSADQPEAALAFLLDHPPAADGHMDSWHALLTSAYLRSGDLSAAQREVTALTGSDEISCLARAAVALASDAPPQTLDTLFQDRDSWSARGRTEAWVLEGEAHLNAGDMIRARACLDSALDEARRWSGNNQDTGSVMGEWLGLHAVALTAQVHAENGDCIGAAALIEDAQTRALRGPGKPVSEEELCNWAARFELGLVTWSVGADATVCAWVKPNGTGGAATTPLGRRSWRTAIRRLREAVIAGDEPKADQLSREIEAELFPPALREELANARKEQRLLLCLHGPLEDLPLSVLRPNFTPVVLPGLPGESLAAAPGPSTPWRLLGAPSSSSAPTLTGAAVELANLARRYPDAELSTGAAFRKGAVLEALASGEAIHIATHLTRSVACEDPRLAPVGLLLGEDEVLCASEVLAAGAASPLVVLAACETAGGRTIDAEGIHGLARAFLEAGTRNLVVTLWPVADDTGQDFAQAFHGALESQASPSHAVRIAREMLRDKGRPPADWAAFRLLGQD